MTWIIGPIKEESHLDSHLRRVNKISLKERAPRAFSFVTDTNGTSHHSNHFLTSRIKYK